MHASGQLGERLERDYGGCEHRLRGEPELDNEWDLNGICPWYG